MNKETPTIESKVIFKKAINASEFLDAIVSKTAPVSQIPIFPVGDFHTHHQIEEGFEITSETLDTFVNNFQNKAARSDIPVYEGHGMGEDRPAVGWIKELINKGDKGLWGIVEWTSSGIDLVKSKAYKYISPEWSFDYLEPETGQEFGETLFAVALVNEPYFSEMPALAASNKTNIKVIANNKKTMELKELLEKSLEELTEEELNFLEEHKEELSDEDASKYFSEAEAEKEEEASEEEASEEESGEDAPAEEEKEEESEEPEGSEESEEEEKEEESEEEAPKEEEEKVEASEGQVRISASELKRYKAMETKLTANEVEGKLKELKLTPAARKLAHKFLVTKVQNVRDSVYEILSADKDIKTERATASEEKGLDGAELAHSEVKKLASEKKITQNEAFNILHKEKPELFKD